MVRFVFTNPRHHLDSMLPVARQLQGRGHDVSLVSLAELRGFRTPEIPDVDVVQALPAWRSDPSVGSELGTGSGRGQHARSLAKRAMWRAVGARVRWLCRGSVAYAVPNDTAWPYDALCASLKRRGRPFALLQEGIRFPLPTEQRQGSPYGSGGAMAVCAWGEASAEHFRTVAPAWSVKITGTPRFDRVDPADHAAEGQALLERLGLARKPLLFLSNTIDDQGFCTTRDKMDLFRRFCEGAAPALQQADRALVAKLHPREDVAAFRSVAAEIDGLDVHVVTDGLYPVLAAGHAAVVLASTVGLEALMFGMPLGVLAIPGHGHVFEYVQRGAAIPLTPEDPAEGVGRLLETSGTDAATQAFVHRHIAHRGQAAARVADNIAAMLEMNP